MCPRDRIKLTCEMPDHDTQPEFEKPAISWNPVISPGDLMIYRGDLFSDWRGDAVAAGLSSQAIVRVELDGVDVREVGRYEMGARIRSIVEGPDGAIWVLGDDEDDSTGRLLKLTPTNCTPAPASGHPGGGRDRTRAAALRKGGFRANAGGVIAAKDQQLGGGVGADPDALAQGGRRLGRESREVSVVRGDFLGEGEPAIDRSVARYAEAAPHGSRLGGR